VGFHGRACYDLISLIFLKEFTLMLASTLIARIEENWERIASDIIEQRKRYPHLSHYRNLSDTEVRARVRDLTLNLWQWLENPDEDRVRARYEELGRNRYAERIPLSEVLEKVLMIRRHLRQFASDHNPSLTPMEIYGEMEMLRTMANFFDHVVVGIARGYAEAQAYDLTAPRARRQTA
jgi:hypothetical protein